MRLSKQEFRGMNNPFRQFLQRQIEFPTFQRMGLTETGLDILEIGCGSGYGALLLSTLQPNRYVGVDLMPEQIALARKRALPVSEFLVRDATDLSCFPSTSWDVVVIFGVLHHIQPWREVVDEIHRVLRQRGKLYVEEPDAGLLRRWDRVFRWGHPGRFSLSEFEEYLRGLGFTICAERRVLPGFKAYCARKDAMG